MDLIGFITEHNNISESVKYTNNLGEIPNDTSIVSRLINYLNKGTLVFSWMGYFTDIENDNLICPDSYYTDGHYIWPGYFPYYLKKHENFIIDKGFITFLTENNFNYLSKLTDKDTSRIEMYLEQKLN